MVMVEIPSVFGKYAGNVTSFQLEGKTVGEVVRRLAEKAPGLRKMLLDKDGNLLHSYDVYVNGESAYPDIMNKPVSDGDRLKIIMLIYGG